MTDRQHNKLVYWISQVGTGYWVAALSMFLLYFASVLEFVIILSWILIEMMALAHVVNVQSKIRGGVMRIRICNKKISTFYCFLAVSKYLDNAVFGDNKITFITFLTSTWLQYSY